MEQINLNNLRENAYAKDTGFLVGSDLFGLAGSKVTKAMSSEEALKRAGLDWNVKSVPIMYPYKDELRTDNTTLVNVRDSDGFNLGVVSSKYRLIQNKRAFEFCDAIIDGSLGFKAEYNAAGSFKNGRKVWISLKMPSVTVLGDQIDPYLVIINSFDGKESLKAAMTPVRILCRNMINLALGKADRTWTISHSGEIDYKLSIASAAASRAVVYAQRMEARAEELEQTPISQESYDYIMNTLFPVVKKEHLSDLQVARNREARNLIGSIYNQKADLERFKGTGWGLYNAVADFETHSTARRNSPTFQENKFSKIVRGTNLLPGVERMIDQVRLAA